MSVSEIGYREIDGSQNNPDNPDWGSEGAQLLREGPAYYGDGISSLDEEGRANPRAVSNAVVAQVTAEPNEQGASNMFTFWGQFLDHDLSFTLDEGPEAAPIFVPPNEESPLAGSIIPFLRSNFDPETGTGPDNPREQVNSITSFIDGSGVYGSNHEREEFVRDEGGKLKVTEGGFLPLNDGSQEAVGADNPDSFVAGDLRANENTALASMHTLFVREHNRLVDEIAEENPHYTDEQLYQEAKAIVEAQIQHVTYNEFLPLLLGEDALPEYQGYDPSVDPNINQLFSAAAFRLGHTLLPTTLDQMEENGEPGGNGPQTLKDAFFPPASDLIEGGLEPVFRGLAKDQAQKFDEQIVDDVRNFLVGEGDGLVGLDLASLNIQRGRDHGLPKYNDARELMGLERYDDFSDVNSDVAVQEKLASVYDSVDDIDVWPGAIAEEDLEDGMVGELLNAILVDQFARSRDGDRFWYENRLDEETLAEVKDTKLSDIILRNTDIEYLQEDVLLAHERIGNGTGPGELKGSDKADLLVGGTEADSLYGGDAGDTMNGDDGHDVLYGEDGDDVLDGGAGHDTLTGGDGADHFVFKGSWGYDTITDFEDGIDTIKIESEAAPGYEYLSITYVGDNAEIYTADSGIVVQNVGEGTINEEDILFT